MTEPTIIGSGPKAVDTPLSQDKTLSNTHGLLEVLGLHLTDALVRAKILTHKQESLRVISRSYSKDRRLLTGPHERGTQSRPITYGGPTRQEATGVRPTNSRRVTLQCGQDRSSPTEQSGKAEM